MRSRQRRCTGQSLCGQFRLGAEPVAEPLQLRAWGDVPRHGRHIGQGSDKALGLGKRQDASPPGQIVFDNGQSAHQIADILVHRLQCKKGIPRATGCPKRRRDPQACRTQRHPDQPDHRDPPDHRPADSEQLTWGTVACAGSGSRPFPATVPRQSSHENRGATPSGDAAPHRRIAVRKPSLDACFYFL